MNEEGTPQPDTTPPSDEQPEAPAEEENGEKYDGGDVPESPSAPSDE